MIKCVPQDGFAPPKVPLMRSSIKIHQHYIIGVYTPTFTIERELINLKNINKLLAMPLVLTNLINWLNTKIIHAYDKLSGEEGNRTPHYP